MTRYLKLLGLALLVACGGENAGASLPKGLNTFSLELGTGSGNAIRAVAGATSYVYVTVVGASERPVTFQAVNLPDFAEFSAQGVLTLQPPATHVGEYAFTLSATAGSETVSKDVRLTVDRANTAPVIVQPAVRDPRGFDLGMGMDWDCMQAPFLEVVARDFDRDPIGLEAVATPVEPADPSSTKTLTYSVPMLEASGYDGTYVSFTRREGQAVKLSGLVPGVAYNLSVRAVDSLGGRSGWGQLQPIKCFPFGINLEGNDWQRSFSRVINVTSGQSLTVPILIQGTPPEPVVLAAEGLPSYARLTGTTVVFEAPVVTRNTSFQFTIVATSGGFTSRATILGTLWP